VQSLAGLLAVWRPAAAGPGVICSAAKSGTAQGGGQTSPLWPDDPGAGRIHCLFCLPLFQGHLIVPAGLGQDGPAAAFPPRRLGPTAQRAPRPDPAWRWAPARAPPSVASAMPA